MDGLVGLHGCPGLPAPALVSGGDPLVQGPTLWYHQGSYGTLMLRQGGWGSSDTIETGQTETSHFCGAAHLRRLPRPLLCAAGYAGH